MTTGRNSSHTEKHGEEREITTIGLHPGTTDDHTYLVHTQRSEVMQYMGSLPCVCYNTRREGQGRVANAKKRRGWAGWRPVGEESRGT